ncbi:MAG TPA: Uma2 family endonuclease [Planctomycetaceae bacterium]|nr:Uma2 family endonuclease [Planctomycetaceae bacterium]
MVTFTPQPMTAEEFARLDIDVLVELVRGYVVEQGWPSTIHGIVCCHVAFEIESWVRRVRASGLTSLRTGIITERNPDSVRGPDVFFITRERMESAGGLEGFLEIGPELAVEVKSPSESWKDLQAKINEYFTAGVQEIWVLEPEVRLLSVYRVDERPRTLSPEDSLTSPLLPEFVANVTEFFRDVPA